MKKRLGWIVVGVVVALVGVMALGGIYRVGQGEEALVVTLGRVTDVKKPGLYWHMPLYQRVYAESITTIYTQEYGFRTTQSGSASTAARYADVTEESVMLTNDNNIVMVEAIYQYNIRDVQEYLFDVENPEGTMLLAFEAVLRRNVQNRSLDDALLNKEEIEQQVLPDFQQMIDSYHMGVQIRNVRIQNINVPDNVKAAYEDVNNAKNEKTRKLDEAERYRNAVLPGARSNAYKLLQEAEAYSAERIAVAQADVALFTSVYAKYQAAPEITRRRMIIETLESVLSNAQSKIILGTDDGLYKVLPLESLLQSEP